MSKTGAMFLDQQVRDEMAREAGPALRDALTLFIRQWNACGPNSDFGRYFQNVREAAVKALKAAGVDDNRLF